MAGRVASARAGHRPRPAGPRRGEVGSAESSIQVALTNQIAIVVARSFNIVRRLAIRRLGQAVSYFLSADRFELGPGSIIATGSLAGNVSSKASSRSSSVCFLCCAEDFGFSEFEGCLSTRPAMMMPSAVPSKKSCHDSRPVALTNLNPSRRWRVSAVAPCSLMPESGAQQAVFASALDSPQHPARHRVELFQ